MLTACRQAEGIALDEDEKRAGFRRIGVVFAVPRLDSGAQPLPVTFKKLVQTLHHYDLDAVAWCFPKLKQKLYWEGKESPGLFLLASLVT